MVHAALRRCAAAGVMIALAALLWNASRKVAEFPDQASAASLQQAQRVWGTWNFTARDACDVRSLSARLVSPRQARARIEDVTNQSIAAAEHQWLTKRIELEHHVRMVVADSGRNGAVHNSIGMWVHIVERNLTILRHRGDRHGRFETIKRFFQSLVRQGDPWPPVALYMSTEDLPISWDLPYFTLFGRSRMRCFLVPDIFLGHGTGNQSWSELIHSLGTQTDATPFKSRESRLFFRGATTHPARRQLQQTIDACCKHFANVSLAPFDPNRLVSVEKHALFKYLLAIRGKSASIRDKYLFFLGSVVLWYAPQPPHLHDEGPESPLFQFTHLLFEPFESFVPLFQHKVSCTLQALTSSIDAGETIGKNGAAILRELSERDVATYMRGLIEGYRRVHGFPVAADPLEYLKQIHAEATKLGLLHNAFAVDGTKRKKTRFGSWLDDTVRRLRSHRG
eukprot:CAMPEP_0174831238 /NCGR_PEP_ID=MMETSP1114-20130205/2982_1 /TAXON_ID=312471 /ORGANISM="Neobodo designis, Strain CCAP 1951/1" /LENGTH=451 /DNA_ID=CAMNT_0016065059 /DNA_START=83 /DNA_END=1438 /DNA_ORIENTATION=+